MPASKPDETSETRLTAIFELGFDNLANAARVITELVNSNTVLTKTNEDLVHEVKKLTSDNQQLKNKINQLCEGCSTGDGRRKAQEGGHCCKHGPGGPGSCK